MPDILAEALNLLRRFQQGEGFRLYVNRRLMLVIPCVLVFLAFSIVTTAGAVVTIGGTHTLLVLLAMVLAPFLLLGSLFVQLFVFFSWLEMRSLAHGRKAGMPPVPWVLAATFVALPWLLLVPASLPAAALLLLLEALAPAAYAALDR